MDAEKISPRRARRTRRMEFDELSNRVIGCAIEVHRQLGPGLLESTYEQCLSYELKLNGIRSESQHPQPVEYKGVQLDCGYRVDLLVEDKLIISGGVVNRTGYYTPQVEECGADQRHSRGSVVDLHETGGSKDWTPDELQCHQA